METNNETVEQVYSSCENVMVWDFPGGPMEYARRFLTAHKRELAAKDAEIASLRALVKELADDLSGYLCESECNGACASFGRCCSQTSRQIVAKAREVVSKMETTTENRVASGAAQECEVCHV